MHMVWYIGLLRRNGCTCTYITVGAGTYYLLIVQETWDSTAYSFLYSFAAIMFTYEGTWNTYLPSTFFFCFFQHIQMCDINTQLLHVCMYRNYLCLIAIGEHRSTLPPVVKSGRKLACRVLKKIWTACFHLTGYNMYIHSHSLQNGQKVTISSPHWYPPACMANWVLWARNLGNHLYQNLAKCRNGGIHL